ncbi:458_t:CDS:2, partial [Dentiscutata erythropus]
KDEEIAKVHEYKERRLESLIFDAEHAFDEKDYENAYSKLNKIIGKIPDTHKEYINFVHKLSLCILRKQDTKILANEIENELSES